MEISLNPIKKVTVGLLILWCGTLFSQDINYKNFNVQNGLTSNEVFDIIQDHEKNIWIATARGVVKYNGEVFTQYTTQEGLSGNVVYYLFQDEQKRIWFLSNNGQLSYYFQSKIISYEYNHVIKKLIKDRVVIRSLIPYKGSLYFGTIGMGSFRIDNHGFSEEITNRITGSGRTFHVDEVFPGQNFLLSIRNHELGKKDAILLVQQKDTIFIRLKAGGGMQNVFFVNRKNGDKLISVYNYLYEITKRGMIREYKFEKDIISLYEDKDSNVWIGAKVSGVMKFTGKNGFNEDDYDANYFDKLSISKTLQDANGNFWFASLENGIFYIPEINIKTLVHITDVKAPFYITAIAAKDHRLYVGTSIGECYVYVNNRSVTHSNQYSPISLDYIRGYHYLNGEIFASGSRGSKYLTGEQTQKKYIGGVNTACSDRHGNVYACINRKLIKVRLPNDTTVIRNPQGCRFESILPTSDGRIWLGSNTGLYQVENEQVVPAPFAYYHRLHVTDMKESKGKLYLATLGSGIVVLDDRSFQSFNKNNGLISEMVNRIIIEEDKYIWAGTTKGLHKINIETGQVETIIDNRKGLPSDEIKMLTLQHDTLYVANNSFVSFFNTKIFQSNNEDPEILLENISVNEKKWEMGKGASFNYDENYFEFTIHSYLYRQLGNIEYKYRLKGLKESYTYTNDNVIRFTFLPPGNYTFEAYALNEDRKQSSKPILFNFTIRQAYWKTTWFYVLVSSGLLFIAGSLIYTYFRRLSRKRNLQLQLLESKQQAFTNQMNPHFIFNALNSVQTYILAENKTDALNYLGKFSKLMRQTLTNTRETLVSFSSEVDLITHYLELEQTRYGGIRYQIKDDLVQTESPVFIPSMLIQPFIENSIKHGILTKFDKEGMIQILFFMKEKLLYCVIDDDGIGLNESKKIENQDHSSAGIGITLDRLKLYCRTYKTPYHFEIVDKSVTDPTRSGTRVEFIIPYTLQHETNSDHH